jgi:hypothetical protein
MRICCAWGPRDGRKRVGPDELHIQIAVVHAGRATAASCLAEPISTGLWQRHNLKIRATIAIYGP